MMRIFSYILTVTVNEPSSQKGPGIVEESEIPEPKAPMWQKDFELTNIIHLL